MSRTRTRGQVPVLGAYKRHKVRAVRTARGIPSLVDIDPYRRHLEWLFNLGFSDDALGRASGLSHNGIRRIRLAADDQQNVQITRAARIRSLTHIPVAAQADTWVPAVGARRRLQALQAIGYSTADLGRLLGVAKQQVTCYMRRPRIQGSTWMRVRDLYNEISGQPGPSRRAQTLARNRGLQPPLAWEGVDIDHPDSMPVADVAEGSPNLVDEVLLARILRGDHQGTVPRLERAAVLDHAIQHGWTGTQLAHALNINREAADRSLVRRRAKIRQETAA